jgi:hypothetical protein
MKPSRADRKRANARKARKRRNRQYTLFLSSGPGWLPPITGSTKPDRVPGFHFEISFADGNAEEVPEP